MFAGKNAVRVHIHVHIHALSVRNAYAPDHKKTNQKKRKKKEKKNDSKQSIYNDTRIVFATLGTP